jgi:hypothetical protein
MLVIHSSDESLLEVLKESSSFSAYTLFQTFDWEEIVTDRNRRVNTARFSFDIWLWASFYRRKHLLTKTILSFKWINTKVSRKIYDTRLVQHSILTEDKTMRIYSIFSRWYKIDYFFIRENIWVKIITDVLFNFFLNKRLILVQYRKDFSEEQMESFCIIRISISDIDMNQVRKIIEWDYTEFVCHCFN